MKIRAVTLFAQPDFSPRLSAAFFAEANSAFHLPVQTTRVGLPPFPTWCARDRPFDRQAHEVAERWAEAGAGLVSLGPVRLADDEAWLATLPSLVQALESLFSWILRIRLQAVF